MAQSDNGLKDIIEQLQKAVEKGDKADARAAIMRFLKDTGLNQADLQRKLQVAYHDVNRWLDLSKKNMPSTRDVEKLASVAEEIGYASEGQQLVYPLSIGVLTWPQVLDRYDADPDVREIWIFSASEFIDARIENINHTIQQVRDRDVRYFFVYPNESLGEKSIKVLKRTCKEYSQEVFKGTITGFRIESKDPFSLFKLYDKMRCVLFIQREDISGFLSIPVEDNDIDLLQSGSAPDTHYDYIWKQVSKELANFWRTMICESLLERLDEELTNTKSVMDHVKVECLLPKKDARSMASPAPSREPL